MNLKNKVKELINISCLNDICNVLPYEDKDIYLIGGATRSILSDKYEIKDIDLVIPDLDSLTVDKILDKYENIIFTNSTLGYGSIGRKKKKLSYISKYLSILKKTYKPK